MNKETLTLFLLFGGGLYIQKKLVDLLLIDRVTITSSKDEWSNVNNEVNFKDWKIVFLAPIANPLPRVNLGNDSTS